MYKKKLVCSEMLTLLLAVPFVFLAAVLGRNNQYLADGASFNATSVTSDSAACRPARIYENLITVGLTTDEATFCPSISPLQKPGSNEPRKHCCSGPWPTLFPQSWSRLASPFNAKLVAMEAGLKKGIEDIKGMTCPPSHLQATTLTVLNQLASENKWIHLLNSSTSPECRLKIVQAVVCPGVCEPSLSASPPCRNLCVNILRGCVSELVRLASPWKHAMNSIRTAVRMLATNEDSGCRTPGSADSFLSLLTTWREPLQWLDSGCEELPQDNCFNGKDVSSYTKSTAALGSSSNPEFPFSELPIGANRGRADVLEFKKALDTVSETLAEHWPRLPDDSSDSEDELGSGQGPGHSRFFNTDDEDLLNTDEFGSGSGDGEVRELDNNGHDLSEIDLTASVTKPKSVSDPPPNTKPPPSSPAPGPTTAGSRRPYSSSSSCSILTLLVLSSSILNYWRPSL